MATSWAGKPKAGEKPGEMAAHRFPAINLQNLGQQDLPRPPSKSRIYV